MKKNILFVSGLPDNRQIKVVSADLKGQVRYKYPGTCDFYNYMSPPDWNKKLIMLDHHSIPVELSGTHYIFNQIAEADTHQKVLARLQRICATHPQIPVFNATEHIALTRRDILYHHLKDVKNLIVPKTIRFHPQSPEAIYHTIQNEALHYPVILKEAGAHNARQMMRINTPEELNALHAFALDGRPYYLIQYKDTAQQGVYTKHRLVMVRGQFYPRHLCATNHWLVNYKRSSAFMAEHPVYYEQESHFVQHFHDELAPSLNPIAQEIYKRIPIDFVGLDCCLLPDGQVMIFEMNANMTLLTNHPPKANRLTAIAKIKTAIYETVEQDLRKAKI